MRSGWGGGRGAEVCMWVWSVGGRRGIEKQVGAGLKVTHPLTSLTPSPTQHPSPPPKQVLVLAKADELKKDSALFKSFRAVAGAFKGGEGGAAGVGTGGRGGRNQGWGAGAPRRGEGPLGVAKGSEAAARGKGQGLVGRTGAEPAGRRATRTAPEPLRVWAVGRGPRLANHPPNRPNATTPTPQASWSL